MFVYLAKKVAVPKGKVCCVQWSSDKEWIAVGGEDGFLKILKLDQNVSKEKTPSTLHEVLEGHSGQVQIISWNDRYHKLTSSDDNGILILWTYHKGSWYPDKITNRNKSNVKGIAWNHDGDKICIIYEDGSVIVGSVDGSRIWGKELKKVGLSCIQWSPDSENIMFGIRNGEFHLYDNEGTFITKVKVVCLPSIQVIVQIASLHWYNGRNGFYSENCPVICIAYQSGHIQLMREYYDDNPIVLDTGMFITKCCWNNDGSVLAVTGTTVLIGENKETNIVQFYSPFGEHLRTLKLPGSSLADCSWNSTSLRIALAVNSNFYYANIRPAYKWTYFSNNVVFSYRSRSKMETIVIFWDVKRNEVQQKTVKSLLSIAAHKDYCILAAKTYDSDQQYILMICDSLATVIDSKCMDVKPIWVDLNSTHVFAASHENFIVWNYTTPKSRLITFRSSISGGRKKERLYHIDDTPSGVAEVIQDLDMNYEESTTKYQTTKDPICYLTCSDKVLLIGRRSGIIQRYTLPQVALIQRLSLSNRPQCLAINCDSTKLSVIDCVGILSLINLQKDVKDNYGIIKEDDANSVERRDVWDMKWASDNPNYLAVMEKNWMYVLKNGLPEEPVDSSAYIADFQDLEIKGILMDKIMTSEDRLRKEYVLNFEVKSLRDTRQLLDKVGISEAITFVEQNPHSRLWALLAEAALKNLDLTNAEMAYVKRNDYVGIRLVKKLANVRDNQLKNAIVASYFGNFDEAENLFLQSDRRDLAISLREKLADWFRVMELMKAASVSSDSDLINAYNNIGDAFAEKAKWHMSKEYFQKANNYEKLIISYQHLEDYDSLQSCISILPEKHPLLEKLAELFSNAGMCQQAVDAYLKFGTVESALETCMNLNEWDKALRLSRKYGLNENISDLFDKHVNLLLKKGRILETIQLYHKADRFLDAALLLHHFANDEKMKKKCSPLYLKKIYVLVGFLVERHLTANKTSHSMVTGKESISDVSGLDTLGNETKLIDNPWHDAEAYHFLMLCQQQLLNGDTEMALRTAILLRKYDDVLNPQQTYSIIAVCAVACQCFEIASKAFTDLESISTDCMKDYENIALRLFSTNEPKDQDKQYRCSKCSQSQSWWNLKCEYCSTESIACVASGQAITKMTNTGQCNMCKHFFLLDSLPVNICFLCHSPRKL